LPAAIAFSRRRGRICVVAASKKMVSPGLAIAPSRSVVQRATPCSFASAATFSALRPTRTGSSCTLEPSESVTPPSARIATTERIRCWFMPMRPVTPFMMMPRVFWDMGLS
jgi:hypothetical protein